jgi:hypothetical protein
LATVALVSGATVLLIFLRGVGISGDSALFISATVAGMLIARKFSAQMPDFYLHAGFASLATLAALGMIYQQAIHVGAS